MEMFFVQLYPFVFVIGMAGYGPQLYKLYRDRKSADGLSLSTWIIWASSWGISLGYGITRLDDMMFCLVAGMNMIAHFAVAGFIFARKMELARENTAVMGEAAFALVPVKKSLSR